MNTIINSQFFVLLNDSINNNVQASKSELAEAFSSFKGDVIAKLESVADFTIAYRLLGTLWTELSTLQRGIIAPNCEAGKKCSHCFGVS